MLNINFQDKNVLVTGASRGIGLQIAQDFLQMKANVFITATSESSFKAKTVHNNFNKLTVDFLNKESTEMFLEKIKKLSIDILINNAGINKINHAHDINMQDWDDILTVNLKTPLLISQAVLPHMIEKKWGRIINIGSVFGVVSKEQRCSYSSSKFGIIGQTKAIALDYASDNILTNAVSPGFIDTELTRNILGESGIKTMTEKVPLKRLGLPSDVSNLCLFLASDANKFITGQNIIIDGGFTSA